MIRLAERAEELRADRFLLNFKSYLKNSLWEKTAEIPDILSVWRIVKNRDRYELQVPSSLEIIDYDQRIHDALSLVANINDQNIGSLVDSILEFRTDRFSIRVVHDDTSDGQIPLDEGVELHKHAHDIVSSAALAAIEKKKYFQGGKAIDAIEIIKNSKLAQSSIGSYIVNISVPLPSYENDLIDGVVPFPRQVSNTLKHSLEQLKNYVDLGDERQLSFLNDSVSDGVSANLCEALAGLSGHDYKREFTIVINRSPTLPYEDINSLSSEFNFVSEDARIFHEAADLLKGEYNEDDYVAIGNIKTLDRDAGMDAGEVTIIVEFDGRLRGIKVDLDPEQYSLAIQAHESKTQVWCKGDLSVRPRSATLTNLQGFRLLGENLDLFE